MSGVSVVVPTRDEGANAAELLRRIDAAMSGYRTEVIFVDDGSDELPQVVDSLAGQLRLSVRVHRRDLPVGRLGGAVVEGIRLSEHPVVVVCDGDLQHPPESIPRLVDRLSGADVVVGSRYIGDGDAGGLASAVRRGVSRGAGSLTRAIFPWRLRHCTDPMSGFFAIRRNVVDPETLRPRGFKILLEILGRSSGLRLAEVPFVFQPRHAGESHAGWREGMRFLRHLMELRLSSSRAALFLLVGLSGVLPNLAVLALLVGSGLHYVFAAALATQVGIAWNFVGAEFVVWRDSRAGTLRRRFLRYALVGETDLVRLPLVAWLVDGLGMPVLPASVVSMAALVLARFVLSDRVVYDRAAHPVVARVATLVAPVGATPEPALTAPTAPTAPTPLTSVEDAA